MPICRDVVHNLLYNLKVQLVVEQKSVIWGNVLGVYELLQGFVVSIFFRMSSAYTTDDKRLVPD